MKVDEARADAWYLAISSFLEEQASSSDAGSPGSLVTALCRVLADAMEGTDGTKEQKLEAVVRLTALALEIEDDFLILKDPSGPVN